MSHEALSSQQFPTKYRPADQDPSARTRGGPLWNPSPGRSWDQHGYDQPIDTTNTEFTYSRVKRARSRTSPDLHWLELHNPTTAEPHPGWGRKEAIGQLVWDSKSGRVHAMHTREEYRGLGVMSHLWEHANKLADLGAVNRPEHSNNRTTGGDAFAKKVGGRLPKNKPAQSDWSRRPG